MSKNYRIPRAIAVEGPIEERPVQDVMENELEEVVWEEPTKETEDEGND